MQIAQVFPSPAVNSLAVKMEVVLETRAEEGGPCTSSEGRECSNHRDEHSSTTEVPSGSQVALDLVEGLMGAIKPVESMARTPLG